MSQGLDCFSSYSIESAVCCKYIFLAPSILFFVQVWILLQLQRKHLFWRHLCHLNVSLGVLQLQGQVNWEVFRKHPPIMVIATVTGTGPKGLEPYRSGVRLPAVVAPPRRGQEGLSEGLFWSRLG